jgi:hypothetical protein
MTANESADRQWLKTLSCGMVSDLSRLLADQGFGDRPLDIVEALAFAMFIVADTYSLAKTEKDQAIAVIHGFYDDMRDYFVNEIVIKDHRVADFEEIRSVSEQFRDLSRGRFQEYGDKFKQDILDPAAMSCPITVGYVLDNLFIEPIDKTEKIKLMGPLADKVLAYWAGCVQSFKG